MKKIQIAIIDSGLNCEHPEFSDREPILICSEDQMAPKDFYGHGTAIYNIIRKVGNIAEITNFKLNDVENGICEDELIDMLKRIKNEYRHNKQLVGQAKQHKQRLFFQAFHQCFDILFCQVTIIT